MLKKSAVAALLLLMLISFTVGSVTPVNGNAEKNSGIAFHGMMAPGFQPVHNYTSVTLDLSGGDEVQYSDWTVRPPMTMPPSPAFLIKHGLEGRGDYIAGHMIVLMAGSNMPQMVPVKFFKHGQDSMRPNMDRYVASLAFTPNGSANAYFTMDSEILVANQSAGQSDSLYNNTITMGQTTYHQEQVTGSKTALNVDLKWKNTADDLRLMIYTPDGHTLGPYTDSSDNATDGRIDIEIDNPAGIADGAWTFKVTGTSVAGKDEYYIRTW